jgi:plastocyanin
MPGSPWSGYRAGFVLTVVALVLGSACDTGRQSSPVAPGGRLPPATLARPTEIPSEAAVTVRVAFKDNVFEPSEIEVPVGRSVVFDLVNEGQATHNMRILSQSTEGRDFVSALAVDPGKESTFEAKFTKTGLVKFQCDYHLPDQAGLITVK